MSAPFANPNFSEAGGVAGHALGWFIGGIGADRAHAMFVAAEPGTGGAPIAQPYDLTLSAWGKTGVTVSADVVVPPNETSAIGDMVADDNSTGLHIIYENASRTFTAGMHYEVGAYVQYVSGNGFGIAIGTASPSVLTMAIDAAHNVVWAGWSPDSGYVAPDPHITKFSATCTHVSGSNNWFLVTLSFEVATTFTGQIGFLFFDDPTIGTIKYAGGSASNAYLWGAYMTGAAADPLLVAVEDLERAWTSSDYRYGLTLGVDSIGAIWQAGFSTTTQRETFESAWSNTGYVFNLLGEAAIWEDEPAVFGSPEPDPTSFEAGWGNGPFTIVGGTAATFDGGAAEDFEVWASVDYFDTLEDAGVLYGFSMNALWGAIAETLYVESFEVVFDDIVVTTNQPTNEFIHTAHGITSLDLRFYFLVANGDLPEPIRTTRVYEVWEYTDDTFTVQLPGVLSGVLALTTDGTGTITARADPTQVWNGPNINHTI